MSLKRLVAAFSLLLTVACSGPDSPAPVTEVELDVFSGRPNPKWTMTEKSVAIWQQVEASPSAESLDEPNHLGYRGFVLRRGTTEARVYNGWIWVREHGGTRTLRDSSRIETALIGAARMRGFGDLLK